MLNQPENETQASMTAEEVRQALLAEVEASRQELAELSEEQLEEIAGGANGAFRMQVLNRLSKAGLIHPDKVENVKANLYTLNTLGNNPSKSDVSNAIRAGLNNLRFR